MTDAARGSRPRIPPNLASGGESRSDNDSSTSQKRPALRFYEPLPLGSDAFMAPLAPPPEPETVNRRRLAVYCIVGGALGIAFGGAALAFFSSNGTERAPSVRVMDGPPPASPVEEETHAEPPAPAAPVPVAAEAEPAPAPAAAPVAAAVPEAAQPEVPAAPAPQAKPAAEPAGRARSTRRSEPTIDKPSRAQVIAAMSQVQPAVKSCFGGTRGAVTIDLKVQGRTGRVASAQVSGQTGPIGSCIARAVRKAQFPKFTDESLSIRYPMAF